MSNKHQLSNVMVKLGGDNNNIVPKSGVTPAEILVLQAIHGADCVTDVRPTGKHSTKTNQQEYDRLAARYDRGAGSFTAQAGEQRQSLMATLFPGAVKSLPTKLSEIGFGTSAPAPTPEPDLPDADDGDDGNGGGEDETVEVDLTPEGEGGNTDNA